MSESTWNVMTGIKAKRVCHYTQSSKENWLSHRKLGIGGSDIASIAGLNPWKSAIDVWLEKTGKAKPPEANEKMIWGQYLEEPVARHFATKYGVYVQNVHSILQGTQPYYLASIDRLCVKRKDFTGDNFIHDAMAMYGNGVAEIKTTGWAQAWEGDEILPMPECQLQWYLGVTGLQWGVFPVLISGQNFKVSKIQYQDSKIFQKLTQIADHFWNENVLADKCPEPTKPQDYEAVRNRFTTVEGTVELASEYQELFKERIAVKQKEKECKNRAKVIDAKIMNKMGNGTKHGLCGDYKVTIIERNSQQFSKKEFREAHEHLYNRFCRSSTVYYPTYKKNK